MDTDLEKRQYLLKELLLWRGWGGAPDAFKKEVSKVILHPVTTEVADIRESVIRFVLNDSRLGDPRLPHNNLNWMGLGEAQRRIIEWLSQLDIVFFFESVLAPGNNPQGRKEFWLRYVPSIVRSRPLLSWKDKHRLQAILKQKGQELAHFGSMDDRSTASAFLLDFGNLLAIEFSETGNACYLYRKADIDKVLPDFYSSKAFAVMQLKRNDLHHQRIVHRQRKNTGHSGGWEEETAQLLARLGIRPGQRR
jgi:hypothetical protein